MPDLGHGPRAAVPAGALRRRLSGAHLRPGSPLTALQQVGLSAYWFATNVHWTALLVIILPSQVATLTGSRQASSLGWLMSVGALVSLVVPLAVGPMSDRCRSWLGRRRPYVLAGTVVNLAGLGLMFEAARGGHFAGYLVGYLVIQVGNNVAMGAYNGVIPDVVPPQQRGTASGFMGLMTQLGSAGGVIGAGRLMDLGHVSWAYLLVGTVLLVMLVVTLLCVREIPIEAPREAFDWRSYVASLATPLRSADFRWVWITRALVMLGFYTVQPFLMYYLRDVIGTPNPEKSATVVFAFVLIGATVSGLLGGWLSDRIGRKPVVYAANALMALMAVVLVFCRTLEQATAVGVVFGLGYGAYISVDWALGTDVLPKLEDAGKDMAVWHVSMVLPQSIAAPIAGVILSSFGFSRVGNVIHYPVIGYLAIFSIAAGFLTLGAVLLRNVRGTR